MKSAIVILASLGRARSPREARGKPLRAVMTMAVVLFGLVGSGCATHNNLEHYYFQRLPVRVAVIPCANATDEPAASIIFNKACEEQLRKRGFEVVEADRVLTFAVASGMTVRELPELKPSRLSAELKVDYLLYTRIDRWATKYHVVNGSSEVSGASWLYEGPTDALMWQLGWHEARNSGDGGGDLLNLLIQAAVTAAANSAFDVCGQMGTDAAHTAVQTLPNPGFEPLPQPSSKP